MITDKIFLRKDIVGLFLFLVSDQSQLNYIAVPFMIDENENGVSL